MTAAKWTVQCPNGPIHCCDNHQSQVLSVLAFLGSHATAILEPPEGAECSNCQVESDLAVAAQITTAVLTPTFSLNSARTAAVSNDTFWIPVDHNTPRGAKLQLINKAYGVAMYGVYNGDPFFTHYAPLPRFKEGP